MAIYQTIAIDNTGDLAVINGRLSVNDDVQAIRDQLQIRLNLVRGNWFLDLEEGLDYFGAIYGKKQIDIELTAQFKQAILKTQGIDRLLSFSASFDSNRNLNIVFSAATVFGLPITNEQIRLSL
jgi:hypothetical protein